MTNFEKVGLFMTTFGQEVKKKPSLSTDKINNLRSNLIEEELNEFKSLLLNSTKWLVNELLSAIFFIFFFIFGIC